MEDNAAVFWENVKKEIKKQNTTHEWVAKKAGISFNTFQGWISKNIFPRLDDAVEIAAVLDTSLDYLTLGTVRNNPRAKDIIYQQLPKIYESLSLIEDAIKEL